MSILTDLKIIEDEVCAAFLEIRNAIDFVDSDCSDPTMKIRLQNSLIVNSVSVAEEGFRDQFLTLLKYLQNRILIYNHLPASLKKSNLDSAVALIKTAKKEDLRLCGNIISKLNVSLNLIGSYQLFDEICDNKGGFKSKEVTELAKKFGIENIWLKISACPAILSFTGEDDLQARTNKLIAEWNNIFIERDTIVHHLSKANGWGKGKIFVGLDLFEIVFKRLTFCLAMYGTRSVNVSQRMPGTTLYLPAS